MIEPNENTRIDLSVRLRFKRQLKNKKRSKKAVFQVEKEKVGLEKCKYKSHLPTRKQAYNENYKLTRIQKSDNSVKLLIAKQIVDGLTGKKIIRETIFGDESFIVVLFTDYMINNIANFWCNNFGQFLSPFCVDFTYEVEQFFNCFHFQKQHPIIQGKCLLLL